MRSPQSHHDRVASTLRNATGPMTINQITIGCACGHSTVRRHLKQLHDRGQVERLPVERDHTTPLTAGRDPYFYRWVNPQS